MEKRIFATVKVNQLRMPAKKRDGNEGKRPSGNGTARKAAEIYAQNLINAEGKTDKEVFLEAGYAPSTASTHIVKSDRFQALLNELIPKSRILKRVNKGMGDDVKDSTALGFCRLGAELHGLVGAKANVTNVNVENANMLITDLLNFSPPGVIKEIPNE